MSNTVTRRLLFGVVLSTAATWSVAQAIAQTPTNTWTATASGNYFPAWLLPPLPSGEDRGCAGSGVGSDYFLLEPTSINSKNGFPAAPSVTARTGGFTYHLENVALLPWYLGAAAAPSGIYSFPDPDALRHTAQLCPDRNMGFAGTEAAQPVVVPAPSHGTPNGHQLIGYWTGSRFALNAALFPLHGVAPQWDVVLVAFASPDKTAPEGTLRFRVPRGIEPDLSKIGLARDPRRYRFISGLHGRV